MATRLSTAYVFEKIDISAKGEKASYAYTIVEKADSGTDAQSKCMKVAEANPGRTYAAGCLWPPVMAKEIRKVTFVNPEDPDEEVDSVETTADESDGGTAPATVPPTAPVADATKVSAPVPAPAPKSAPAPKATTKPAPKAEVAKKVEAPKVEVPKTEEPKAEAPKEDAPKAEAPKKVNAPKVDAKSDKGYSDLFGNDEPEAAPEAFVNADEPVEKDQDGPQDAGGLF